VSIVADDQTGGVHELLLRAVAEELKLPLLQVARSAELYELQDGGNGFTDIRTKADMALRLVDGYLLGLELNAAQSSFELEPVSVSAVLNDTAHELQRFAKLYGVSVTLDIATVHGPVMAHRRGLQAALMSLGSNLVAALSVSEENRELQLALHRAAGGLVAGVYGTSNQLNRQNLRHARQLYGHTRQPLNCLVAGSAAGIFVADTLLQAMSSRLLPSRHANQYGLAASLPFSRQLTLV
jgi:hypothetical protein